MTEHARYADNRHLEPGTPVTCTYCDGRGWVMYETGKRRPHDLKRGECRTCKGTGKVAIGSRVSWTIYTANSDGRPTFHNVNPKLYTPVQVVSVEAAIERVTAALWDTFPLGCTENELREVVTAALPSLDPPRQEDR